MPGNPIKISGARQHNLKNISLEIPRGKMTVFTGVSGSGKSSLAFDTLYAEGQHRYLESMSTFAQNLLKKIQRPDVDCIEGLSPTITISQYKAKPNPRSTIATSIELYDYLRILYANYGIPHDPATGETLVKHSLHTIIQALLSLPPKTKIILLAPLTITPNQSLTQWIKKLKKEGFVRARIHGKMIDLDTCSLEKTASPEDFALVVDRIKMHSESTTRLRESLTTSLHYSKNRVSILTQKPQEKTWKETTYTTNYFNPKTNFILPPLTPACFSFNHSQGACSHCHGLGTLFYGDTLCFTESTKSLHQGGINLSWLKNTRLKQALHEQLMQFANKNKISLTKPIAQLSPTHLQKLLYGTGNSSFEGIIPTAERLYQTSHSKTLKRTIRPFLKEKLCPECCGGRLKPAFLNVKLANKKTPPLSINQFTQLRISEALQWMQTIHLDIEQEQHAKELLDGIQLRLRFLQEIGLDYLYLDRKLHTLSQGEKQRIRLARQISSQLSGILYILDEPSVGLHPQDNEQLLNMLKKMQALGNTLILVEHDEETMRCADHIVEFGPQAGERGGEIIFQGSYAEILKTTNSPTGHSLRKKKGITPQENTLKEKPWIYLKNASTHNLNHIDVSIPLEALTCITGVSGSGKSSLIEHELPSYLSRQKESRPLVFIDQQSLGISTKSSPVTYIGAFHSIRNLFAQLPTAKARGHTANYFSLTMPGGRCEECRGNGTLRIEMQFLSDAYALCPACQGKRYHQEALEITYKGKNIQEILEMPLAQANDFFSTIPILNEKFSLLNQVGLHYLKLGQPTSTLSGGEIQRLKIAKELSKKSIHKTKTIFVFDEPTTGLHSADIAVLLDLFFHLRKNRNTLIIVEHHIEIIQHADWIIDLGPGGGPHGGKLLAEGPLAKIMENAHSPTGKYLRKYLSSP